MHHRSALFSAVLFTSIVSHFPNANAQVNRHPLARPELSIGAAAPETRLDRMILVLRIDSAKEQELETLLAAQQEPGSRLFHQWLTPETFAERFGVPQHDIARVVSWLGAQGFSVDELPAGSRSIIFSGTAAQVQAAFHTELRHYRVRGQVHFANASDPQVPENLVSIVRGVVSLHDFRRQAMHSSLRAVPQYSAGGGYYYLAPGDFATIYNVNSLYASGVTGAGQHIAIVARCNIPLSDVQTFRQTFGLPANNPTVIVNGIDPGIVSADELGEADLDVQWSGAVAPQAAIDFVVSGSTYTTDGVDLSAQYIVSHNLAPVMSTSFGLCEAWMGAAERAFYNSLWQQASAQGITTLISSGDSGAAGCDSGSASTGTGGSGVNGLCSTPYSVCVGGTQFNEGSTPGQYWSINNGSSWSSALGYIPETVWNESGSNGGQGLWASGGGASAYYPKPAWQSAPGVPADGRRDVPDVSLTSAGHDAYMMFYQGDLVGIGGTSAAAPAFAGLMALVNQQTGSRQGNANVNLYALASLQGSGGLSYFHDTQAGNNSVPGVSGFAAVSGYDRATGLGSVDAAILVNHWNDANGSPGLTLNVTPATLTLAPGKSASVTVQVAVPGGLNGTVALSTAGLPVGVTASFAPASLAAPGSGSSTLTLSAGSSVAAGSYIVAIQAMGGGIRRSSNLSLTVSVPAGCTLTAVPASLALIPGSSGFTQINCGTVTGGFDKSLGLNVAGAPQGVSLSLSTPSISPGVGQSKLTVTPSAGAPTGSYTLTVSASGGGLSLSLPIPLKIDPAPAFTWSATPTSIAILQGASGQLTITAAHVGTFNSSLILSVSGMPSGVTASFSPGSIAAPGDGSSKLTIQAPAAAFTGTYRLTLKATGGGLTRTLALPLTIQTAPGFTLTAAPKTLTVAQGATGSANVTISALVGEFNAPVLLTMSPAAGGSLPKGLHATFIPATIAAPGSGTSILSLSPDNTVTPTTYPLTLSAKSGNITRTAALSLVVTAAPGFTLRATTTTLNALVGGAASTQISAMAVRGFSSAVTLSAHGLPAGVSVTFSPPAIAGNGGISTIKAQTASNAVPGSYVLNVTGTSGSLTGSVAITLNVGKLILTPSLTAMIVKRGASTAMAVTTSVSGAYNGAALLSATGLPKGITATFTPSTISKPGKGTSTLTVASGTAAVTGKTTISLNAVSDGSTKTVPVTLTVQ